MNLVVLCHETGWTFTELMEQPQWFILGMAELIRQKAKNNKL